MRRLIPLTLLTAVAIGVSACGGGGSDPASAPAQQPSTEGTSSEAAPTTTGGGQGAPKGDPREGGFEVALGEWAVTPESEAIRPGR